MENPLIEFRNVTKRFDSRTILEQVNLKIYEAQVPEGECFEFVVLPGLAEGKSGDQIADHKPVPLAIDPMAAPDLIGIFKAVGQIVQRRIMKSVSKPVLPLAAAHHILKTGQSWLLVSARQSLT